MTALPREKNMTVNTNKKPAFWDLSEGLTAIKGGYRLEYHEYLKTL